MLCFLRRNLAGRCEFWKHFRRPLFWQSWDKLATVHNPLFPFASRTMRNILHSQIYNNIESPNAEHILKTLRIQEYTFQDVGKAINFNHVMSWFTTYFGDHLLQILPKPLWASFLLCFLFLTSVCLETTAICKHMIFFCDPLAICNDSLWPIHTILLSVGPSLGIPINNQILSILYVSTAIDTRHCCLPMLAFFDLISVKQMSELV